MRCRDDTYHHPRNPHYVYILHHPCTTRTGRMHQVRTYTDGPRGTCLILVMSHHFGTHPTQHPLPPTIPSHCTHRCSLPQQWPSTVSFNVPTLHLQLIWHEGMTTVCCSILLRSPMPKAIVPHVERHAKHLVQQMFTQFALQLLQRMELHRVRLHHIHTLPMYYSWQQVGAPCRSLQMNATCFEAISTAIGQSVRRWWGILTECSPNLGCAGRMLASAM